MTTSWPSLSSKGAGFTSFYPSALIALIPSFTFFADTLDFKHEMSTGHPNVAAFVLWHPQLHRLQGSNSHICLIQLGHPAPFRSFLPFLVAPAVWRLSYDILCLYVLGKLLTSEIRSLTRLQEEGHQSRSWDPKSAAAICEHMREGTGPTPLGIGNAAHMGRGARAGCCPGCLWRLSVSVWLLCLVRAGGKGGIMTHSDVFLCCSLSITVKCPDTLFSLHAFLYLFTFQRI